MGSYNLFQPEELAEAQAALAADNLKFVRTFGTDECIDDSCACASVDDFDADGDLELLLGREVKGEEVLPKIRVDPGSNQDKEIAIRVRGLDDMRNVVAFGGIEPTVLFESGQLVGQEVPFNLAWEGLPPHIVAVVPYTETSFSLNPAFISFYSSKPLALDSEQLREHVRVQVVQETDSQEIDVSGILEGPYSCPFGTQMWSFVPEFCHKSITAIILTIDPEVTDTKGMRLQEVLGAPGFSHKISLGPNSAFGPCELPVEQHCLVDSYLPIRAGRIDVICNQETGLFEPVRCSIAPQGCLSDGNWNSFDWVLASEEESRNYTGREDAIYSNQYCVFPVPWPCSQGNHCMNIGTGICNIDINQCSPKSCQSGSCNGDNGLVCTPQDDCLPAIGGCTESCRTYGGCPRLDQFCITPNGSDRYHCRQLPLE